MRPPIRNCAFVGLAERKRTTVKNVVATAGGRVLGVQVRQTFDVRNSDPLLHNVHTLSRQPGNRGRNIGQPVKGMTTPFVFNSLEVFVQFNCDVHPWMFAYVGVVDHPWFAVTDGNGNFALSAGLPAGQYTIAAVHQKAGEVTQSITVTENGTEPVQLHSRRSKLIGDDERSIA